MEESEKREMFAKILGEAYERWRSEKLAAGVQRHLLSENRFATEQGFTKHIWSSWVNASQLPSADNLQAVIGSKYIGRQVSELLLGGPVVTDPLLKQFVTRYPSLNAKQRALFMSLLEGDSDQDPNPRRLPAAT